MVCKILDKQNLISELRDIHKDLVKLYNEIFNYKYINHIQFSNYIKEQYSQNNIKSKDRKAWNENFCHRASYTLLNKILFVRICEDKGFMRNPEDYIAGEIKNSHIGEKLSKIGLQKWASIITNYTFGELVEFAFLDMKKSYNNIVLYKDNKYEILNPTDEELDLKYVDGDKNTKEFVLEFERILSNIVRKLDTEKYDFAKTDSNILGDVYEQFMDRETRKAIGQFYTPEFVIEYILTNTVEEADVVENPFVTVADIACGSGHFLIMAYDILKKKFINNLENLRSKYSDEIYIIRKNNKEESISGEEYWVKENIHYHLLKHCIYGADIDSFAVQLTTINLLLKDLDNFTDELNVVECDSLIKWEEDYDWEDLKEQLNQGVETIISTQVNLLGEEVQVTTVQKKELFNLRFSNIFEEELIERVSREKAKSIIELSEFWSKKFDYVVGNPPWGGKINSIEKDYYNNNYKFSTGSIETFVLFIERAMSLLEINSYCGYIVPDTLLFKNYGVFRKHLIEAFYIKQIFHIGQVFTDANIDTTIILIKNEKASKQKLSYIKRNIDSKVESFKIDQHEYLKLDDYVLNIALNETNLNLKNKIDKESLKMNKIIKFHEGIHSGNIRKKLFVNYKLNDDCFKLLLAGSEVNRYFIDWRGSYVHYSKDIINRSKGEYASLANQEYFESDKILVRRTGDNIIAYLDPEKYYASNNFFCGILEKKYLDKVSLYYLSAILNSRLIQYYYRVINPRIGNLFPEIKIKHLKQLPVILDGDINKIEEIAINYKKIIENEKKIMKLQVSITNQDYYQIIKENEILSKEKKRLIKYIELLENELESNVFKLYGLTELEVEYIMEYTSDLSREGIENNDNMQDVYQQITSLIIEKSIVVLQEINKEILLDELKERLIIIIKNFNSVINIMQKDNITKKSNEVIKVILNGNAYTWNAYRKALVVNKVNKIFIKYYDSNYYGLSEWSDEIHKQYFMDAIEEYTVSMPNEKKAKDILELFKDLDIEDKQDYIEIIEAKINRAFK